MLHHVCNRHEWYQGQCEHEELIGPPTNIHGVETHILCVVMLISNYYKRY